MHSGPEGSREGELELTYLQIFMESEGRSFFLGIVTGCSDRCVCVCVWRSVLTEFGHWHIVHLNPILTA